MKKLAYLLLIFCLGSFAQTTTIIHCGTLIDTEKGKSMDKMSILIQGNTIQEIKKGFVKPGQGVALIDLSSKTVLPGLIDMHVHLESEMNPKRYLETFTLNEADVAFYASKNAKTTLMAGFTTVRDLGGSGVNTALRNAIYKDIAVGPRIYSAGKSLATTGGHADPTNGYKRVLQGDPGPKEGVVNGVDDAKKAVRQRYKNGADVIKITATGGVLSVAKSGHNPQFTLEEITAITTTAKDYGMHVAAHAHGDEGMQRAIMGGVKTIEHGTFMSDQTMTLMKDKDVYLVPTITAGKAVTEKAKVPGYFPDVVIPKALEVGPKIQSTFKIAYKKGVPIAFGTDAGVFTHGENANEFVYMVEAGMDPMDAIQSATIVNSNILKMGKLGILAPGYLADIIAVDGDPIKNIEVLTDVKFVMKDGVVYKDN
ncbi:MAG: amidohydrolase family protein [Flavobacteriaceae bacterium]